MRKKREKKTGENVKNPYSDNRSSCISESGTHLIDFNCFTPLCELNLPLPDARMSNL
jgi:hypothetical protein